jgi:hypothetical protein
MVLGVFYEKIWREDIFKSTIRNENPHEISNENWSGLVNLATLKKYNCQE